MALTYKDLISSNKRGYGPYKKLYYDPGASLSRTVRKMTDITEQLLEDIEEKRGSIEEFEIGKTFARKKKRQDFDSKIFKTWKLAGGVNGRWNSKYESEGFDGLIALCALTRESLPSDENYTDKEDTNEDDTNDKDDESNEEVMDISKEDTNKEDEVCPLYNHQDYALAVKQQLIHYFAYKKRDARLANTSLSTGKVERKGAKAYVIYMAFKIEREE